MKKQIINSIWGRPHKKRLGYYKTDILKMGIEIRRIKRGLKQ